jgi:hypothetical protein
MSAGQRTTVAKSYCDNPTNGDRFAQGCRGKAALKYNKYYIGLNVEGAPLNFVTFRPRRAYVLMDIKLPKTQEFDDQLEEAGIETLDYEARWGRYRVRIDSNPESKQREVLLALAKRSRESFGKLA